MSRAAGPVPDRWEGGYEHLGPLFAELAALPVHDPRRAPLRARLILGHRPVARHIARRFGSRGEPAEDIEQVANLGLVLAVDRFDPSREVEFLSFAVPTITGEVLRHLRDRSTPIRVPRRLRELHGSIHDAVTELTQRHGRAPRPAEIATFLGTDLQTVWEGLATRGTGRTDSLDEPSRNDQGLPDRNRFDAALGCVETRYELVEQRDAVAPLLAALPERERRILRLRFYAGLSQSEIGDRVGVSQMHVSRLLTRTLAGLRRSLAD